MVTADPTEMRACTKENNKIRHRYHWEQRTTFTPETTCDYDNHMKPKQSNETFVETGGKTAHNKQHNSEQPDTSVSGNQSWNIPCENKCAPIWPAPECNDTTFIALRRYCLLTKYNQNLIKIHALSGLLHVQSTHRSLLQSKVPR